MTTDKNSKELTALFRPFGKAIHGMVEGLIPLFCDALAVQAIQEHRLMVTWVKDTVAVGKTENHPNSPPSAIAKTIPAAVRLWLQRYDPDHALAQADFETMDSEANAKGKNP